MRAAVVQMRSGIDRAENRIAMEALVREAAAEGAGLVVTPEMTNVVDGKTGRLTDSLPEEEALEDIPHAAGLARDLGLFLLVGSFAVALPPAPDGTRRVANRSLLFGPRGEVARYDKIHLFDVDLPTGERWHESRTFAPGAQAVLARLPDARLGLSICYDVRFPHLYRALAQAGAEILTVPAAFTRPTGEAHWAVLLRARAIETGSFVLAAAQGGEHEDGRATWGHSMIINPWGDVIADRPDDRPGIVCADLDLDAVRDARTRIPSLALERPVSVRTFTA